MSDTRRSFLTNALTAGVGLSLAGCDKIAESQSALNALDKVQSLTKAAQRALIGNALAPEYTEADISPDFRANGSTSVDTPAYKAMARNGFTDFKLKVEGLVEKPLSLSLAQLRKMPARTQITRHDCVEGWSCIGKWKGVTLQAVLDEARVKPDAKYIVFHCADEPEKGMDGKPVVFYGSIDLADAAHPQTILAYDMNDKTLSVAHGAPLRLRLERALGYKMSKYIMRIEVVADYGHLGDGKGGYWEDHGYEWYAGI